MHTPPRARLGVAAFASLGLAAPAAAHDFFLLPSDFTPAIGQTVMVEATVSAAFPRLESVVAAERMGARLVRAGGAASPLATAGAGPAARLSYRPQERGDSVLTVTIPQRDVEYPHDRIGLILEEYHLEGPAAAAARALSASSPLQVTSTRFAKTVLCVETCAEADDLRRPAGLALEFVAGEKLGEYLLLAQGRPAPAHPVAVVDGGGKRQQGRTDDHGRLVLAANVRGPTMLFAAVLAPPQAGGRFRLDLTTLTLEP